MKLKELETFYRNDLSFVESENSLCIILNVSCFISKFYLQLTTNFEVNIVLWFYDVEYFYNFC